MAADRTHTPKPGDGARSTTELVVAGVRAARAALIALLLSVAVAPLAAANPHGEKPEIGADPAARTERVDRAARSLRRELRKKQLALAAGLDPALSISRDWRLDARQRAALRQVLGYDRWRRLGDARFQLQLRELQGYWEQRDLRELPVIYDQIEGQLRSNFGKLARDYLESRLGWNDWVEERRDRLRAPRRELREGEWRMRLSPRVTVGDDSYLGAKLEIRGRPFWSRFSLGFKQHVDSAESGLKLSYEHGLKRFFLEHNRGDLYHGDTTSLSLRWAF